jgi:hypothetical protein
MAGAPPIPESNTPQPDIWGALTAPNFGGIGDFLKPQHPTGNQSPAQIRAAKEAISSSFSQGDVGGVAKGALGFAGALSPQPPDVAPIASALGASPEEAQQWGSSGQILLGLAGGGEGAARDVANLGGARYVVETGKTRSFVIDTATGKAEAPIFSKPEAAQASADALNASVAPYDQNALSVKAAVQSVPESAKSDIRKMLRGEVEGVTPAEITPEALASHPEFGALLDSALTQTKAEVSPANRVALAQQVLDAQAIRNKIIVAKGYRNVPELPPDAPIVQEALKQPDGGAAVFDRTRQVLDAAKGEGPPIDFRPEPPTGPKLIATGGPNEPSLPDLSGVVRQRGFGLRDLGSLATEVMYNGIVFPKVVLTHAFGSSLSSLANFPEQALLSGVDAARATAAGAPLVGRVFGTRDRLFMLEGARAGLIAQGQTLAGALVHDVIPEIIRGPETAMYADIPKEVSSAMLRGEYGSKGLTTGLLKAAGGVGKVAALGDYPLRTMAALDNAMRRGLSASFLAQEGYLKGLNSGLRGDALHKFAAEFVNEAGPESLAAAEQKALVQINRQAPGFWASKILGGRDASGPIGSMLLPFFNTPLNILKAATTWSPLGWGRLLPTQTPLIGHFAQRSVSEAARVQAVTRAAIGTALTFPIWQHVLDDNITGDGPTDPRQKAIWIGDPKNPSHVERAIRTPVGWLTYGKVPVLGDLIAGLADAAQGVRESRNPDVGPGQAAMLGLVQFFSKQEQALEDVITFAGAGKDLLQNPNNPQAQALFEQHLAQKGFSLLPASGLMNWANAATQPNYRTIPVGTKGFVNRTLEEIKAQIPLVNQNMRQGAERIPGVTGGVQSVLPVRVAPAGPALQGTASGIPPVAKAESDRLAQTIQTFKPIPLPTNKIGVGKPYELTLSGTQYLDFAQAAGQARSAAINKLLATPAYQSAPDGVKARLYTLAVQAADRKGEQDYLRNGVLTSTDPAQTQQDALLLMTQGTITDRTKWAGLMAQSGKLTSEIRAAIDAARPEPLPGQHPQPTMDEYVRVAPLVSDYLALPPYLTGNPQEWESLGVARAKLSDAELRIRATGAYLPPTALRYEAMATLSPAEQNLIMKYQPVMTNPARRIFLMQHPEVGRFVSPTNPGTP